MSDPFGVVFGVGGVGLLAQVAPIDIRTKVFASNDAIGRPLNSRAQLRRDRTRPLDKLAHELRALANRLSQRRCGTARFAGVLNGAEIGLHNLIKAPL